MSAFVRRPDQLFLEPVGVARSIGIRVLLVTLLGFPARLFNSTVKANRATIVAFLSRWAGPLRVLAPRRGRRLLGLTATSVVAAAVVHWFLDPGFPGRLGAIPFAVGMMLGFAAIVANANLQARAYVRRHVPEASLTWQVFPGQIAFSIVCVLVSRLGHLVPGVFFGVAGDMVRNLDARHEQASWHGS